MASQGPPPNQGDAAGAVFEAYPLAPVGTFLGIACITTGLRIYWRIRPTWRIGADDYTLVFALVRPTSSRAKPCSAGGFPSWAQGQA